MADDDRGWMTEDGGQVVADDRGWMTGDGGFLSSVLCHPSPDPLTEFALIQRFFTQQKIRNLSTRLGIGDDCALLSLPDGYDLAVTTDTMVENVHFFAGTDPKQLGHKVLAVNLSDLASMGAKPVSVTLALTLPAVDEDWLTAFAKGFLSLAERYSVDLIGGDTTSGPLTLTVQAMGLVPRGKALMRQFPSGPCQQIFLCAAPPELLRLLCALSAR